MYDMATVRPSGRTLRPFTRIYFGLTSSKLPIISHLPIAGRSVETANCSCVEPVRLLV